MNQASDEPQRLLLLEKQVNDILDILKEQEKHIGFSYGSLDLPAHARAVINATNRIAFGNATRFEALKQEFMTELRALVICAEGASMASTHRDKDARIAGIISVVEIAISRIKAVDIKYNDVAYLPESLMGSDYNMTMQDRRIRQLEEQLRRFTQEYGPLPEGPVF